jgi:CheY-like chemotaxis protein
MDNKHRQLFDLITLIRQGDFDIRKVADANPSLTIKEYFDWLMEFVKLAPSIISALPKIADANGDKHDFLQIKNLNSLFNKLGERGKLLPAIEIIAKANENSGLEAAALNAKKTIDDFEGLFNRVVNGSMEAGEDDFPGIDRLLLKHDNKIDFIHFNLKEVCKHLDNENETRKLNILAIDDSPVILRLIISALDNYNVHTLAHQEQLDKYLQQTTPELFILDCQMPGRTGFDLVPVIRGYREHADTPIMFLTALASSDYVANATTLGACDFMVKPLDEKILQKKVGQHIVRKKIY